MPCPSKNVLQQRAPSTFFKDHTSPRGHVQHRSVTSDMMPFVPPAEYFWPPSPQSAPQLVGLLVVMISFVVAVFWSSESEYVQKARKLKVARIQDGMKMLLADVRKKDESHKASGKKPAVRTEGLPELSRVVSYL